MTIKNKKLRFLIILLIACSLTTIGLFQFQKSVNAGKPVPGSSGPDRFQNIKVDVSSVEWWMTEWETNDVVCAFFVDHPGLPNATDISSACDKTIFKEWLNNNAGCLEKDPTECPGYYFIKVSEKTIQKDLVVKLAPPSVRVSIEHCEMDDKGWCTEQPNLILSGVEPLPNEKITRISGFVSEDRFDCEGNKCLFKLSETNEQGIRISFWSESSFGDSSPVYSALIKVTTDPNKDHLVEKWQVDVFSTQWDGPEIASCGAVWETFRPTEGLPNWLRTPLKSDALRSNIPYEYLASNLIQQGVIDVAECPNGGFSLDGSVNACGIEAAKIDVTQWQNRFDKVILKVAREKDVPAQLLKNLFSRESQFWPGVFRNGVDVGLGQMTQGGADTTLLWNPIFYKSFCPLILENDVCQKNGYSNLTSVQQKLLQASLVNSVDARCDTCPLGLDLSKADFSISIFAHTLLANCEQTGKIVENVSGSKAGEITDFETMWKFTLVNYNAGSGCLSDAITNAYDQSQSPSLTWGSVASQLNAFCPGAVKYVEDVTADRSSPDQ